MKIVSFNIRVWGRVKKKKKIRNLILMEKLEFITIQETKMELIDKNLCEQLWGNVDCGCSFCPVIGNAEGLLNIWDSSKGGLILNFSGFGFAGVCLEWVVRKIRCFIVNVYAPCNLVGKRKLRQDLLMSKRGFGGAIWCVVGDFNAVCNCNPDQRRRLHDQRGTSEIEEFNN